MKLAICDDEQQNLEQVAQLIRQSGLPPMQLHTFSDARGVLEAAREQGGFDVYILDVVMPGMDGIRLGKQLRSEGFDGKIIYLTSSQEYAVESYRVKAYDYLLKPVDPQALIQTLEEVCDQLQPREETYISVKTKEGSIRLRVEDVLYVQLNKRTAVYYMTDGRHHQSVTLRVPFPEAMKELLEDRRFVLCGQGLLANLQYLTMVETEALVFRDTEKVYLGVKNCRELRPRWADFWFGGEERGC